MIRNTLYKYTVVATCLLLSCSEETVNKTAPGTARILFTQVSPRIDPAKNVELYTADVTLGNNNRKGDLAFGGVTVTNPKAGEVFLKTRLTNDTNPFLSVTFPIEEYAYYSLLLANVDGNDVSAEAAIGLGLLKDDLQTPGAGNVKVRLIHLGVGVPEVDCYFFMGDVQPEPVATSLGYANIYPGDQVIPLTANNVSSPVSADFTTLPAGTYNYNIRLSGADPMAEPQLKGSVTMLEDRVYTIIIRGYLTPPAGFVNRSLGVQTILHERKNF